MTDKKGLALFFVLSMLLITVILANVVLSLILNQSRFTHHKISRIQAYYAAQAGVNYALEQLRTGAWVAGVTCPVDSPCTLTFAANDFRPASIVGNSVTIIIKPIGANPAPEGSGNALAGVAPVIVTATYTYTNPT